MIISLYYFTDCLFNLAILVLFCVPNGPDIVGIAGTFAASTAFSGIIYFCIDFIFYYNFGSECVIWRGIGYL